MYKRLYYFSFFLWCVMQIIPVKADVLVHGPYLQLPSQTSMTIRWRTDVANKGTVFFGNSPTNLNQSRQETAATTEHEVTLVGLQSDTMYSYAIGYDSNVLAGGAEYRFRTFPATGSTNAFRVWVLGDPGTGTINAQSVYSAYQNYTGTSQTDLMLTLGDNAYSDGTDEELHSNFFSFYPGILRTTPVFPGYGNHDSHSSDSTTLSGPFYDNFSLPANGECGGTVSGTEAYYSFDYGNAHFICLDSAESDRTQDGAMYAWLEQDLVACTSTWIIAYWHHPPYTMGTHNSDDEAAMVEMRSNMLPLLEQYGVDLVLGGHSHTYERTWLMDGHYGTSESFDFDVYVLNKGDGQEGGNGVYMKPSMIAPSHRGTVYVVAGFSGQEGSLLGSHPAIQTAITGMGSLVLDIASNRLDLVLLDKDGNIPDRFSIVKDDGDYDGDGMPDIWEQDMFRINVPPTGDADNDTMCDLDEYIAGTNPNDPTSYFRIFTNSMGPAGFVVGWTSVSNRSYNVRWSYLPTNTMVNLATNILYPQNAYTDRVHAAYDTGFYQLEVGLSE